MSADKVYATDHSAAVLQTHSWRTLSNSAGYLIPHLKPGMKVLDVGCGPGSITVDLARHVGASGHVTGVDYTDDPLDGARHLAALAGISRSSIDFRVADIHSLPFPDDSFDLVHAHQVLQHIRDPVAGLREMRRVVRPAGIVACRESASMTLYPDRRGVHDWFDLSLRVGAATGGHPHPGSHIHVWAEEAGFGKDRIARSAGTWCFSTRAEREYFGGSFEARMRDSGFARTAVEKGFATRETLDAIADAWREYIECDHGWLGMLHGEILCWKD